MKYLLTKDKENTRRPRVDRFIIPREVLYDLKERHHISQLSGDEYRDIWVPEYLRRRNFVRHVNKALNVEKRTIPRHFYDNENECNTIWFLRSWPCRPRKKKYLKIEANVLDMPSYNEGKVIDLLDWSKENVLIAALDDKYHTWNYNDQKMMTMVHMLYNIHCCKFNNTGHYLAIGLELGVLVVHSVADYSLKGVHFCVNAQHKYVCMITTVDWCADGNTLVAGCSEGWVTLMELRGNIFCRKTFKRAIHMVRVSPCRRYVAVIAEKSTEVKILSLPELQCINVLEYPGTIKNIVWHPWHDSLLAIQFCKFDQRAAISLWNISLKRLELEQILGKKIIEVDSMLFNPKTGELVLGLWDQELGTAYVTVMSDHRTVVDSVVMMSRIRTMVFNPDGTTFAAVTENEELCFGRFLPEEKERDKNKILKLSALVPSLR